MGGWLQRILECLRELVQFCQELKPVLFELFLFASFLYVLWRLFRGLRKKHRTNPRETKGHSSETIGNGGPPPLSSAPAGAQRVTLAVVELTETVYPVL